MFFTFTFKSSPFKRLRLPMERRRSTFWWRLLILPMKGWDSIFHLHRNFFCIRIFICIIIIEGLTLQTARDPFLKKNYANLFWEFFFFTKLRRKNHYFWFWPPPTSLLQLNWKNISLGTLWLSLKIMNIIFVPHQNTCQHRWKGLRVSWSKFLTRQ